MTYWRVYLGHSGFLISSSLGDIVKLMWQKKIGKRRPLQLRMAFTNSRKLSFGLMNAPACFMRAMYLILRGLCWSDCLVYLDDIIVIGQTLQEHRERQSLVLSHLTKAGLKINPRNASFCANRWLCYVMLCRGRA